MCADTAAFCRVLKHQSVFVQAGVTFRKSQRAASADPAVEMSCNCTCKSWEREESEGKRPWRDQADVVSVEGMLRLLQNCVGEGESYRIDANVY